MVSHAATRGHRVQGAYMQGNAGASCRPCSVCWNPVCRALQHSTLLQAMPEGRWLERPGACTGVCRTSQSSQANLLNMGDLWLLGALVSPRPFRAACTASARRWEELESFACGAAELVPPGHMGGCRPQPIVPQARQQLLGAVS